MEKPAPILLPEPVHVERAGTSVPTHSADLVAYNTAVYRSTNAHAEDAGGVAPAIAPDTPAAVKQFAPPTSQ